MTLRPSLGPSRRLRVYGIAGRCQRRQMAPTATVHSSAATGPSKSPNQGNAVHSQAHSNMIVPEKAATGVTIMAAWYQILLPG